MSEQKVSEVPQIRFKEFEGEWALRTLGELCLTTIGEFVIKTRQNPCGEYPVFNGGRTYTGFYDSFNNEGNKIVISARGANAGYVNIVRKRYWAGNSCYSVSLKNKCNSLDFFFSFIKQNEYRFLDNRQSANIPSVSKSDVENFEITIPTPEEQTQIGGYFRELDRLIGLHQRKHDKLVTLKKAMLQKMFPQPSATTPEIRFKGFSGDWMEKKFNLIASRSSQSCSEKDLPRIEYEDIISGSGRLNKNLFKKVSQKAGVKFAKGDVLFGKLRPYLRNWWLAEFEGIAVGDFWVLTSATAMHSFLYCLIQTEAFERIANQSAGSKMPRSDWKLVSNSLFRAPSDPIEQQKIGTYFRTLDELISKYATQLKKLQQIKSACLEKMFV